MAEEIATKAPRGARADARRNRERIFAAAKACFEANGAAAGMPEIARAAGVGVGSLYRAFGSRAGLAEAIYRDALEVLVEEAARSSVDPDSWQALVAWLHAYVTELHAKRTMLSELYPLFERDPALLTESRLRAVAALDVVLRRAQGDGRVRTDLSAADLMQLVNGAAGLIGDDLSRARRLLKVVIDGLKTSPGRKPKPAAEH